MVCRRVLLLAALQAVACRPAPDTVAPVAEVEPAPGPEPRAPAQEEPAAPTRTEVIAELVFDVPDAWVRAPTTSNMRVAVFVLPGNGGEVELVVYRFPGGAGGVAANLERWAAQIDGDAAKPTMIEAAGLKITRLDLAGTYVGAVRPGAEEHHNAPNSRMLVAIVEGAGDPFYIKCVGPAATVDPWAAPFDAALGSLRPASI